ncbi:MAG: DUF4358 domain-containing protein [Clostridia bacterium]|nr:DUF4358 domain-containing protein [Clostridia bacterium]
MNQETKNVGFLYPIIMAVLCLGICGFIFSMCWGGTNSSADINDVADAVLPSVNLDNVKVADANMIIKLYGIDPANYAGAVLYYPITNMEADELFIVKLADNSQKDAVVAAAQSRLATQLNNFDGYGDAQTAMLNASKIYATGNYVIFVSGDKADESLSLFKKAL